LVKIHLLSILQPCKCHWHIIFLFLLLQYPSTINLWKLISFFQYIYSYYAF
jgi:hypothetical protein